MDVRSSMQYQTFSQSIKLIFYTLMILTYSGCSFIDIGTAPEAICLQDNDCATDTVCREGQCITQVAEICDQIDNDVDGIIDETVLNICGECGNNISECSDPMRSCDDLSVMQQQQLEQECITGDEGSEQPGIWRCENAMLVCDTSMNNLELCDGIDNDSDTAIDEELIQVIECPVGSCRSIGEQICEDQNLVNNCAIPLTQEDNSCDGIDDDCDGLFDEDYASRMVNCGINCEWQATTICVDGNEMDSCDMMRAEIAETCNETDDDCDGEIDEGLNFWYDQGNVCGVGVCMSTRKVRCIDGLEEVRCTDDLEIDPSLDPNQPGNRQNIFDLCDGLDDDCDGEVDEDSVPFYVSCDEFIDPNIMDESESMDMGVVGLDMDSRVEIDMNTGGGAVDMSTEVGESDMGLIPPSIGIKLCESGGHTIIGCQQNYVDPCLNTTPDENCPQLIDTPDYMSQDENLDGVDGVRATGIFVSSTYGDNNNNGRWNQPVRDLARALDLNTQWRTVYPQERARDIYMQAGEYQVDPMRLTQNVNIYGAYVAILENVEDPNSIQWTRPVINDIDSHEFQTVLLTSIPAPVFSVAHAEVNVTLMGLTLQVPDGVSTMGLDFRSPIGLIAIKCEHLVLDQIEINVGQGAEGLSASAASPIMEPTSSDGSDAVTVEIGLGGVSPACCSNGECSGGDGGVSLSNGNPGLATDNRLVLGGVADLSGQSIHGSNGFQGEDGFHAQQDSYFYEYIDINSGRFVLLESLPSATDGISGSGGGGGGGNNEFSPAEGAGGGGGSGGCGGSAGSSGYGGGWSIGMVLTRSCNLEAYRVSIKTSQGGQGGRASSGLEGYDGGSFGNGIENVSGNGGPGGKGGCGGNGIGGQGGSSIGFIQDQLKSIPSGITIHVGSSGVGGEGIASKDGCTHGDGASGLSGQSAAQVCCAQLRQDQLYLRCSPCNERD
jgi:hypothetical protein